MPIITRSNTTGPTKTMTGVKRKFIEILDSDDDVSTDCDVETDSEHEVEADPKYDAVLELLARERDRVHELEQELDRANERIFRLKDNIREFQSNSLLEIMCFMGVIAATLVTTASAIYSCNNYEYKLLTI
jgi:hypothetical protein